MPAHGGAAAAMIVGVYPSAFHVTWTAPRHASARCKKGRVQSLAVDVEPTVFWDGDVADFAERLDRWKRDVGFREGDAEGEHGHVSAKSAHGNGSSGATVAREYLAPLGVAAADAAFTDIAPVFFAKVGTTAKREQLDAIRQEYDVIAPALGMSVATLPQRPTPARLCELAATTFRARILGDLERGDAPLVVTLGKEVWTTFMQIRELAARPPTGSFDGLRDAYGTRGSIVVRGRTREWLPLVHPGLLRGDSAWAPIHRAWVAESLHAAPAVAQELLRR